ncbi:HlyD family type I secretion periplasmic adaptor subunit [Undibacterium cyanobacteriorum]|uniref:Membrane fusion protein (MFP) family protein n=1 Tax=Undibacterium cyanobacteriorum TaxID=3073561 RepID=A0ABY9RM75_9BURK|nr:HlyD family type I secretion periplasmic adaptor subunit [Undibacterium sp. 20NA77.5]WMW81086.1 HlyD family type I secretion periplasmic adaptor subunit [Undibacterium sp. 20NA77.5]
MNLVKQKSNVTDVVAKDTPVVQVMDDPTSYTRLGWILVLIFFVAFLGWGFFAPLDKGVPMSGNVTVATNRKMIQHQVGGTVDEILVKDGEHVKAGQVLLRMNSVASRSAAEIARVQLFTAQAMAARLDAEREGARTINFPKELLAARTDPRVESNIQLQQQLFSARQGALTNELAAVDETIAGLQASLKGMEESMESKKLQQQLLKEQLDGVRDLAKDGYIAKSRLFDVERTYAQINGSISEDIGNMSRISRQIGELKLKKLQRQQEYQKEVRTQLTDAQKEAEALNNRLQALDFELKNVEVKAPVSGTIVGMNVFTKSAVVPSGFKLMELVPDGDPLIVEGMLPVHLVDKVHKGLKVQLIFSAFNANTTPHIPGVVTEVAADRTVDERSGQAFYKVRAEVAPEGLKMISNLNIRPGMPVELFVITGERTMMNYLFKPVLDRANSALSEE